MQEKEMCPVYPPVSLRGAQGSEIDKNGGFVLQICCKLLKLNFIIHILCRWMEAAGDKVWIPSMASIRVVLVYASVVVTIFMLVWMISEQDKV